MKIFVWGLYDGFYAHVAFKNNFESGKVLYVCFWEGVECVRFVCILFKVAKNVKSI